MSHLAAAFAAAFILFVMIDLLNKHGLFGHCAHVRNITEAAAMIASAAISAAGSAGSAAIGGGKMNKKAQREAARTRHWQSREREASQLWQEQMMDKANQWNLDRWHEANDWNLDQWNRENEYNSMKSQLQRANDAGVSPLAILNGADAGAAGSLETSSPESAGYGSPSAPSASLPQMFNPSEAIAASFTQFAKDYIKSREVNADIRRKEYQNNMDFAKTLTENLQRGIDVQLGWLRIEGQRGMNENLKKDLEKKLADIAATNQEIQVQKMYAASLGASIRASDVARYCAEQKLPYETQKLLTSAYVDQTQGDYNKVLRGGQLNKNRQEWTYNHEGSNGKTWQTQDLQNRADYGYWQAKEAERSHRYNAANEFSVGSLAWMKGWKMVDSMLEPISKFGQGLMFFSIGRHQTIQASKLLQSTENPATPPAPAMTDMWLP